MGTDKLLNPQYKLQLKFNSIKIITMKTAAFIIFSSFLILSVLSKPNHGMDSDVSAFQMNDEGVSMTEVSRGELYAEDLREGMIALASGLTKLKDILEDMTPEDLTELRDAFMLNNHGSRTRRSSQPEAEDSPMVIMSIFSTIFGMIF